jgi:myo-inositol-1-phosphate synthase
MASNFQDLIDARLYHQQPPPPPTTSFASLEQRHLVRRQVKRVEDLDRRSLSLYNDLEEIKRKLVQLANQSNPQRLESELRRAATNILGPIMGSMHDETRLALENIRSVSNGATSRAEMAYAMAAAAKAELNAFQVQQSVPNEWCCG